MLVYQRVVFQAPGPFSKEFSFLFRQAARAFCQLAALDTEGATGHTVLGAVFATTGKRMDASQQMT